MHISAPIPVSLIFVFSALTGCEYGPPAIANGYLQPATFSVAFADDPPFEGTLPQGSILWQPQRDRHVTSITVTTPSGTRHYSATALQRLRGQRRVKDELWVISASGIRLEDSHDAQRIRKELPTPPKA
jgi:hypothetical protein